MVLLNLPSLQTHTHTQTNTKLTIIAHNQNIKSLMLAPSLDEKD